MTGHTGVGAGRRAPPPRRARTVPSSRAAGAAGTARTTASASTSSGSRVEPSTRRHPVGGRCSSRTVAPVRHSAPERPRRSRRAGSGHRRRCGRPARSTAGAGPPARRRAATVPGVRSASGPVRPRPSTARRPGRRRPRPAAGPPAGRRSRGRAGRRRTAPTDTSSPVGVAAVPGPAPPGRRRAQDITPAERAAAPWAPRARYEPATGAADPDSTPRPRASRGRPAPHRARRTPRAAALRVAGSGKPRRPRPAASPSRCDGTQLAAEPRPGLEDGDPRSPASAGAG